MSHYERTSRSMSCIVVAYRNHLRFVPRPPRSFRARRRKRFCQAASVRGYGMLTKQSLPCNHSTCFSQDKSRMTAHTKQLHEFVCVRLDCCMRCLNSSFPDQICLWFFTTRQLLNSPSVVPLLEHRNRHFFVYSVVSLSMTPTTVVRLSMSTEFGGLGGSAKSGSSNTLWLH